MYSADQFEAILRSGARRLHKSGSIHLVDAAAGCTLPSAWLVMVTGSSATVRHSSGIKQSRKSMADFLSEMDADGKVNCETALDMSMLCFKEADADMPDGLAIGLAVTASCESKDDRIQNGPSVAYLALTMNGCSQQRFVEITFERDNRWNKGWTRWSQNQFIVLTALNMLLEAAGLEQEWIDMEKLPDGVYSPQMKFHRDENRFAIRASRIQAGRRAPHILQQMTGDHPRFFSAIGGSTSILPDPASIVGLPSSIHPITPAHIKMLAIAAKRTGLKPVVMLEMEHPDKGTLSAIDVQHRLYSAFGKGNVILTKGYPLYVDKAKLCKALVIGEDVYQKIVNPDWYDKPVDEVVGGFRAKGVRFLVFFRDGTEPEIPDEWADVFEPVAFESPVSSTAVRRFLANAGHRSYSEFWELNERTARPESED